MVKGSNNSVHIPDVSVHEAWSCLERDAGSLLIDVRTHAEWTFVGVPDLTQLGKTPLFIEWQTFPDNRVDPAFGDRMEAMIAERGGDRSTPLLFICRSGGRSFAAAREMAVRGYVKCSNVADGFEGPLDPIRHRGQVSGWKVSGLPWRQG
ncbi:MAG: rhodanese-like domain-containing protein [Hyphomicrobiaceae bacterium]